MLNHTGRKREATPSVMETNARGSTVGALVRFSKAFVLIFLIALTLVVVPAQIQLHLRCRVDVPAEQLGLRAGHRRVQPPTGAVLSPRTVLQHTRLFLLRGLPDRYGGLSTLCQAWCQNNLSSTAES